MDVKTIIKELGIPTRIESVCTGTQWISALGTEVRDVISPVDGSKIADVVYAGPTEYEAIMKRAQDAFVYWRAVPAPKRGEIIRQIGNAFREQKEHLGALVSYEMGKSLQEGLGEVQEIIDICDFALGISKQLYGLTIQSERTEHRIMEQYHPLGVVGIITAFNFPVAVWAWNAIIATVCGNVTVWKPSEKTPASAVAVMNILKSVCYSNKLPEGIFTLINGNYEIGQALAADSRIALVSATGSTRMGKEVAKTVAGRLGKSLLELGGNNAVIISEHADLNLAIRAIVFGATGTAGQRCTTTRRLIIHTSRYEEMKKKLLSAYKQLKIGNPLSKDNHIGPLIDKNAVDNYTKALEKLTEEGGTILCGNKVLKGAGYESGCYVEPTIAEAQNQFGIVQQETFAPILYLMQYNSMDEAIAMQNDVKQGLSSAIFSDNMREVEHFLSFAGSDCGIANVNMGTSGAEIGGAFGGEKETGGGRESGSDAWKAYMRRQTNTINYGSTLPLAQGIEFNI